MCSSVRVHVGAYERACVRVLACVRSNAVHREADRHNKCVDAREHAWVRGCVHACVCACVYACIRAWVDA